MKSIQFPISFQFNNTSSYTFPFLQFCQEIYSPKILNFNMIANIIAVLAFAAAAQAVYAPEALGYGYGHGHGLGHLAVGAQSEQTVRGYGGLQTVSHQSKAVVSPHSHVQKTDTRVTNAAAYGYGSPAYGLGLGHGYAAAPALAHGAAYAHGYAAPALAHQAAYTHGYAAPALARGAYATGAYGAPALAHQSAGYGYGYAAAPALAAHGAYAPSAYAHGAYAAPALTHGAYSHGYAAPVPALATRAIAGHPAGLLGSAYSAVSPAVSSHTFSRTLGGYGTLAYAY